MNFIILADTIFGDDTTNPKFKLRLKMWNFLKKDTKEKTITIKGLIESEINLVSIKETLLETALNHNIDFPHKCKAGGCGSCKCILMKGEVKELKDSSYVLSEQDLENNCILACQSIPKTDIVVAVNVNYRN